MTDQTTKLYCCGCVREVVARLTDGGEIYPHRPDLADLPFWKCDACGNYVGCHHKTKDRTQPFGCIPTKEIKKARQDIHTILDPIWQSGRMARKDVYAYLSEEIGWEYHTAKIRSVKDAHKVCRAVQKIAND